MSFKSHNSASVSLLVVVSVVQSTGTGKTSNNSSHYSDVFSIGGRSWNVRVYPNGVGNSEGNALSMFLNLNENEKFRPYERIYVRAKLRVLNQRQLNNAERELDTWFSGPGYGASAWGYNDIITLANLKDSSKGFIVNDMLKVEVEMLAISLTKYLPN